MHGKLLARHRAVMPVWMSLYYEQPIALVEGRGCEVWDADGKKYLDLFGGILTTMIGHSVPEVVAALSDQAGRILHTSTVYLIEEQICLAERIAALSGIPDAKVFFTSSGTEATELALLLCASHRRSNQVLAVRGSYHGRSFAAMGVTGNRSWSASSFSPLSVSYVQSGYRFRSPFGHLDDDEYILACVNDLKDVIDTSTSGVVAAMIAEPIQGVGGFTVPPDGFLGAFQSVLDDYGILFISDEVQTGWGRTGQHFWGYEAHGVRPDVLTFAKGLGNGLAVGGVVAGAELMDSLGANSISTFGGNPLAMRAANAVLDYHFEHDLQSNAARVGDVLMSGLLSIAARSGIVGDVRGKGLMIGVELVVPGTRDPSPALTEKVMESCRRRGILVGKGGLHGNVLRISPPLTFSADQAEQALDVIGAAVAEAEASYPPSASRRVEVAQRAPA